MLAVGGYDMALTLYSTSNYITLTSIKYKMMGERHPHPPRPNMATGVLLLLSPVSKMATLTA